MPKPKTGLRTSRAIDRLVKEAVENNWPEQQLVDQLKLVMPLDERRRVALVNYRRSLKEQGMAPALVASRVAQRAAELKEQRSRVVARTETTRALTEQRQEPWGDHQIKKWKAKDGSACPICKALDGTTRRVYNEYDAGITGPPAHPNCRCTEELIGVEPV